jgi:hypothetical protein
MCQHLIFLLLTLYVSTFVLGHHQAHDEYKPSLIELNCIYHGLMMTKNKGRNM